MHPHVLIIGADGKGSFIVRGQQLGAAIGARVTMTPTDRDWAWADVIVLVKRAAVLYGARAAREQKPIVWDVLDFWVQPEENQMPVDRLRQRVRDVRDRFGIATLIGATRAMADAIGGVYLPHHSWPGLAPAAPRRGVSRIVIGYEGRAKYLGSWRRSLEAACALVGMDFVINPDDLRQVDVVVAFRGERWDGEVCRQWKSGVKYVNALVAGRPVLTQPCAGFTEIAPVGQAIERQEDLEAALLAVSGETVRAHAYEVGRQRAEQFSLPTIAAQYRTILASALQVAA